jgi:lysophospholipase L1-like esterase
MSSQALGVGRPPRRSAVLRELQSWATWLLVALCVLVGIPAVIVFTPDQQISVAGQHLSIGARTPSLSLSGPAQLVQIGNTELDITPLDIFGPLRPRLTLGPVQRNAGAAAAIDPATSKQANADALGTVIGAFVWWYVWATILLVLFTLAATAAAGYLRILVTLRRHSREQHRMLTVAEIWHQSARQIRGMSIVAVVLVLAVWVGAGLFAYRGTVAGLHNVRSVENLVGTYYVAPSPEGPPVQGYTGAVIGDSRASRVGGPLVADATPDDKACGRSSDSLANEVGRLLDQRVLNLACPSASIPFGLRAPQEQNGRLLPAQVGVLKQMQGLRFVVVMIGPNDLAWTDFLKYCYSVDNCQDRLTEGEFTYRLAALDRDYGNLLQDLNDLPGKPQIIVVTSYDVFKPDASCDDAQGPPEARGLNPQNIQLLLRRNAQLNDVLANGAGKYTFDVARPALTTLCEASHDQLGPDLQGLTEPYPFHPTGIGMIRIASSVARVVKPSTGG